jgi:hypothetical protein
LLRPSGFEVRVSASMSTSEDMVSRSDQYTNLQYTYVKGLCISYCMCM